MTLGLLALAGTAAILPAAGPAASSTAAEPAAPAHPPTLQGTWTLDEDLTARMRETDQQHAGKEGSGGGFGRHGGGGRRGGGGGGRRGGGEPGSEPGGEVADNSARPEGEHPSFAALAELTITQQGRQVTITDKEGHARVLTTDGSRVKDAKGPGGPAEVQASWDKDGSLVVQVKPERGPKRTESYIVSDDGKHLYIVLEVEGSGGRPAFKIRRAYDPAAPAEKPAPAEASGEGDSELA